MRPRFSLSTDAFARGVIERGALNQPDCSPDDYAGRLCLDDLYLATACAAGDEDAWGEFRERYFSYIRDFSRRFVHERAAADVADQVIADLWQRRRLAQYDGRSTLKTWLGAVVAHAAINAGRLERRMTALDEGTMRARQRVASPSDEDAPRVFAALIERAVADLEPEARLLLLLYYEQGLTLDQMGVMLGASKATLSRRLERLRQGLRDSIETRARQELRMNADSLRERLDFSRLEFDLAAALGGGRVKGNDDGAV